MKKSKVIPLVVMSTLFSSFAYASLEEKYKISEPLAVDVQKRIFSKIFDVELWSATYPKSYSQDITIRIKLATSVGVDDITEFMADEAQDIHGFSNAQMKEFSSTMEKSISCIPTPDSIMDFNYVPKKGIEVVCDGVSNNVIVEDGVFTTYLLDIFLHEKSEYTKLAQ